MIHDDDIDGLAAEYAIGSLTPAERGEVELRCKTDAALAHAVAAWQLRLAPLDDLIPGVAPPPELFPRIMDRIRHARGNAGQTAEVVSLRRSARRWRVLAVGASALAACLALVAAWLLYGPAFQPAALVAELYRATGGATADEIVRPAFIVRVDPGTCQISVRPVTARPRPGHSYQLWMMREGAATPVPLGIIRQSETTTLRCPGPADELSNSILAVSLEPEGGATTGKPTEPLLFVGKLVARQQGDETR